jgi:hypothetical protein
MSKTKKKKAKNLLKIKIEELQTKLNEHKELKRKVESVITQKNANMNTISQHITSLINSESE